MQRKLGYLAILLSAVFVSVAGCSDGEEEVDTVSVSGKVTWKGEPLENVAVNFYSKEHDFLATGVTGSDGSFTLYQGAAPGENKVWIEKNTQNDADPAGDPAENPEVDPGQIEAMSDDEMPSSNVADQLPSKFSNPDETVLTFKVPTGGTEKANFGLEP